jgi:energy-coupling factor transport system substrate-specific component
MKKISIIATVIIAVLLVALTFTGQSDEKLSFFITLAVFTSLILSYLYFENSNMGTKEIALIATLSTFAAVSRAAFAALPNIKPTTFLVALSGYVFGPYEGFLVGSTAGFISNIFLGQGPWTPWQMFSWGLIGAISGFLGKRNKKLSAEAFSIICFLYGFLFNWIMNLWHVLGFVKPINLRTIALAYLSGLTFDIMHAASSFIFCIIFYDSFLKVFLRFKRRLSVTYINGWRNKNEKKID